MKLPNDYVEEMKLLLKDDYDLYEQSLNEDKKVGIRINTGKISVEEFKRISPFNLVDIPYINNGFIVEDTDALSKHPYYFAGLYYIQEPSAMIPASCIEISSEDKVLDLCAAPGGKATAILSRTPQFLLANDISYSRTIPLVKNLELFGARSYAVTAETPEKLSMFYEGYFDKVLVDAPCSGEGMFRKDPSLINAWLKKRPKDYSEEQLNILSLAIKMLKPGGTLVYSTCTFAKCEDEEVVAKSLESNSDIILDDINKFPGFSDGYNLDNYHEYDFTKCVRIFPHRLNGEGHFVAKIKRTFKQNVQTITRVNSFKYINQKDLPEKIREFLSHIINEDRNGNRFLINDDFVYMINPEAEDSIVKGLHYSRTGMLMGQIKKGIHFSPYSPFALTLGINDFDNVLNLKCKDPRTIKYLKGETIFPDDNDGNIKKGYTMICVDGYSLGFAQYDGNKYKNLYPQGWRYNGN